MRLGDSQCIQHIRGEETGTRCCTDGKTHIRMHKATFCKSTTLMERRQRKALRGTKELRGSDESETVK